jgi:Regulator of chromosome condensation (RCC1) repeat
MRLAKYLMLVALNVFVACANPPEPLTATLTSSNANPVAGSSVTLTATASPAGTIRSLEILEGSVVIGSANGLASLEQSVVVNSVGTRSFTARVTDTAGVVVISAAVEVKTKAVPVAQVAMGNQHMCVLLINGDVRCWGGNDDGELGLGNTNNLGDDEAITSVPPIKFPAGFKVTQITAGARHTCAMSQAGNVICWGENSLGQLGLGDKMSRGNTPETTPDKLVGIPIGSAVQIISDAQAFHTCALLRTDEVKCWGAANSGQLGLETNVTAIGDEPNELVNGSVKFNGSRVKQLGVGSSHTCVLLQDASLHCWGASGSGQLGHGTTDNFGDDPGESPDSKKVEIADAIQIELGSDHTCVNTIKNKVRCWGSSTFGELGYGNTNKIGDNELPDSAGFVDIEAGVAQISVGSLHNCALLENREIKCWGRGQSGRLGYADTANIGNSSVPSSVGTVNTNNDPSQGEITQVYAGGFHTCILFKLGSIKCWGLNAKGQLGYGNKTVIGDDEPPSSVGIVPLF